MIDSQRETLNLGGIQASKRDVTTRVEVHALPAPQEPKLLCRQQQRAEHATTRANVLPIARHLETILKLIKKLFSNGAKSVRHGFSLVEPCTIDGRIGQDRGRNLGCPRLRLGVNGPRDGDKLRLDPRLVLEIMTNDRQDAWILGV